MSLALAVDCGVETPAGSCACSPESPLLRLGQNNRPYHGKLRRSLLDDGLVGNNAPDIDGHSVAYPPGSTVYLDAAGKIKRGTRTSRAVHHVLASAYLYRRADSEIGYAYPGRARPPLEAGTNQELVTPEKDLPSPAVQSFHVLVIDVLLPALDLCA